MALANNGAVDLQHFFQNGILIYFLHAYAARSYSSLLALKKTSRNAR